MDKSTVIVGNPMVAKVGNENYSVVYAIPPHWNIIQLHNLTRDEVSKLPFVNKTSLEKLD